MKHKYSSPSVTWPDVAHFLAEVRKDHDRSIRITSSAVEDSLGRVITRIIIQVCSQVEGKVWIEYSASYEWQLTSDRSYEATLLIWLHRVYNEWGRLAHAGI